MDDLISWWTWPWNIGTGPYGHAEVWTPEIISRKGEIFDFPQYKQKKGWSKVFTGTCYTSTLRDNYKGTCKRPASEVLKHPERWDYMEFDIPEDDYNRLVYWMDLEVENNKGYDMKASLSHLTPWRFHNIDKNNCSEFGHNAAIIAMIKDILWRAVKKQKTALPHDFYIWQMPTKIAYLSRFFKLPSPRRLSKMLPGKMIKLK